MQQVLFNLEKYQFNKEKVFRNRRDELVSKITEGINKSREGTKYKPINKRTVALLINRNPFLAKSDDEIELLYNKCEKKNYSLFFYITK